MKKRIGWLLILALFIGIGIWIYKFFNEGNTINTHSNQEFVMKLSRVEIITGISKIEPLKKALGKFHITGMTVYQVLGCGVQHGTQEFEVEEKNKEISLLPKEVVMIVLPTEELDGLLEFVKKELYTGHIGDGKIFVSDVTNVIRVRTGEEGIDALLYGEK